MENINLLYTDLFCGAGGTSTGVESTRINGDQVAKVIACVNHDANAIASHAANHPEALHFTEDIRTLELSPLIAHAEKMKVMYPDAYTVLWASLECTNFSKAKGGQPRDADSRTLAEHLFRYIESLNPDYISIENVEEFMGWGAMDENGKPISSDKGKSYLKWVKNVCEYGYEFQYRILNSADYGAYTSRKRFFGIFAKPGLPIVWPEQSHSKEAVCDISKKTKRWKPVKDVLDFTDEGDSIFCRKKPLSDKTLERIYAGLIKFVAGGKDKWLLKYNSINKNTGKHIPPGIDDPCPVISCQNRLGLVNVQFLSKYYSGHPESKNISVEGPAHTIKCIDNHSLVKAKFLAAYYGTGINCSSIDSPCPTVPTKDRFNYVSPKFIANYYSGGGQLSSIEDPCSGITVVPKQRVVQCNFIDQQFGNSKPTSIDNPLGALTQNPKYNIVTPWIMNTNFSNTGSSINVPAQTITANRKWHYLMNPQFRSSGGSINNPCFTLIARMDKMPPYFVSVDGGEYHHDIFGWVNKAVKTGPVFIFKEIEAACPIIEKILNFMFLYGIVDIKMRMLRIPELKRIMGFPEDYVLIGTQADQKKFIGNAVEVTMARSLCKALAIKLREYERVSI